MVRIRKMTDADVDAVAAIRVAGWRAAYRGLVPRTYLDAMDPVADAARHRARRATPGSPSVDLVATASDEVVGWACFGPYREDDLPAPAGELYALYVRPALIGTGVGRSLCAAAMEGARERGDARMALWVLKDNARARRFYGRAGFVPDGAETTDPMDGVPVTEVRYVREPLRAR
ncbi:GNAT family N-acetyltransferase [Streptomyces sp. I05A-00742]|uniref:GNAT family N-acetyltransferase n=1 Tax=Streptomyces sp. I05A-00742 TaxID=2732853 RepID=UPI001489838B|nr:GNAT family N-acetyltransferase [Streptomyces sp. I05A-00742]